MKNTLSLLIVLSITFSAFSQNFGVDQPSPSEKLDVNGNIKTDAIVFSDATTQTKAPRIIHTYDTRSGCPPAHAANTDLLSQTFTLTSAASISTRAAMIRNFSGRADLFLFVDGGQVDWHLNYTSSTQWEDGYVQWAGTLAAGSHTISIRSNVANVYGCGSDWGSMQTMVFE